MSCNKKKFYPRGDDFYYIEVWDKGARRSKNIEDILGFGNNTLPKYLTGGIETPRLKNKVYLSIFWKNISSTEFRIKRIEQQCLMVDSEFVIRKINRKEFIKLIPATIKVGKRNITDISYWYKNYQLKQQEIRYISRIKDREKENQMS